MDNESSKRDRTASLDLPFSSERRAHKQIKLSDPDLDFLKKLDPQQSNSLQSTRVLDSGFQAALRALKPFARGDQLLVSVGIYATEVLTDAFLKSQGQVAETDEDREAKHQEMLGDAVERSKKFREVIRSAISESSLEPLKEYGK